MLIGLSCNSLTLNVTLRYGYMKSYFKLFHRHGNNYGLFQKRKKKKLLMNRVVCLSTIIVITVLVLVAIISSAVIFRGQNNNTSYFGTSSSITTDIPKEKIRVLNFKFFNLDSTSYRSTSKSAGNSVATTVSQATMSAGNTTKSNVTTAATVATVAKTTAESVVYYNYG